MKNIKEHPTKRISKINTVYMIALSFYLIYFLTTTYTVEKAIALCLGILIGTILLTYETIKINK